MYSEAFELKCMMVLVTTKNPNIFQYSRNARKANYYLIGKLLSDDLKI